MPFLSFQPSYSLSILKKCGLTGLLKVSRDNPSSNFCVETTLKDVSPFSVLNQTLSARQLEGALRISGL